MTSFCIIRFHNLISQLENSESLNFADKKCKLTFSTLSAPWHSAPYPIPTRREASPTAYQLSIQTQTQGISLATPQFSTNSPLHKKLPSSLVESWPSITSVDTPTIRDRVTSYSNNSNDIFQSKVIFEKLKVTKLKSDLLDDLRVEIKDIIKKELESLHTNSTHSTTNYITEIKSLKRELDIKERMITQLLNTVKEISTVNTTQGAKPRPIFTCENKKLIFQTW